MEVIDNFQGKFSWLSMAAPVPVEYRGRVWPSVLHALTACRLLHCETYDVERADSYCGNTARSHIFSAFNNVSADSSWYADSQKDGAYTMLELFLRQKFSDLTLARKLIDTRNAPLLDSRASHPYRQDSSFAFTNLTFQAKYAPDNIQVFNVLKEAVVRRLRMWKQMGAEAAPALETAFPKADALPFTVRRSCYDREVVRFVRGNSESEDRLLVHSLAGRAVNHGPVSAFFDEESNIIEEKVYKACLTDVTVAGNARFYIGINLHGNLLTKLRAELQSYGSLKS